MSLLRPYHYGLHKWDDYVLDIHESIEVSNKLQRQMLQKQVGTIDTLERGLGAVRREQREQTGEMVFQLEELRTELAWGFGLVVDRMDQQIQFFAEAITVLDEIDRTLKVPLRTQARELFERGEDQFRKELYEEALESFTQAEEKNKVDPLLQLRIGILRLEGRNGYCNVIDLPQAEQHSILAARYAQAEQNDLPHWNVFCARAHYQAAQAAYLIGEREQISGNLTAMQACLERALGYLSRALQVWQGFTDVLYCQAKCHALLGQNQQALEQFTALSDRDRTYYAKSLQDADFDAIRDQIEAVFKACLASPGPMARSAQALLGHGNDALKWAKLSQPSAKADLDTVETIANHLGSWAQSLNGFEVSIEQLNPQLRHFSDELEEIAGRTLQERIQSLEGTVGALNSEKKGIESSINYQQDHMNRTEGSGGMGCLFVVMFYVIANFLLFMVGFPLTTTATPQSIFIVLAALIAWLVFGYHTGKNFSKHERNSSLRLEMRQSVEKLREWHRTAPLVIQKAETDLKVLRGQLDRFLAWSREKPVTNAPNA